MAVSPRIPQYIVGTIAVGALSGGVYPVVGVGTAFASPDGNANWPICPGDLLICGNAMGVVGSVTDATHLSLTTWTGGVVSAGAFYAINRYSGLPNSAVAGLVQMLSTIYASAGDVLAEVAAFHATFLGAFASDSAANAFASANTITLTAGQTYVNTTEGKLRVYSGSAWGDYDATAQAAASSALASAGSVGGVVALVQAAMATANTIANVITTATFLVPNALWSTYYGSASGSAGSKTMDLGSFISAPFVDEAVPLNRMALSQGSSSINLGGVPT